MSKCFLAGLAYICCLDNSDELVGRLITLEGHQYRIDGRQAASECGEDVHTCCYDLSTKILDLTLTNLLDPLEVIALAHVIKAGGDNCSLHSDAIEFSTDELLVGGKAESFVENYLSPHLVGTDCLICIGQMSVQTISDTQSNGL